ncbi:terpene synthase family protein [Sorangium sp. So ce385]|uniref:terpene synthase family protein n=1 Tax=Sorangium sp. So ce385 TaxID=3133308 RepID=UPI003F5C3DC9
MSSDRTSVVVTKSEADFFEYPFPASRHPKVDVVERRTLQWVRRLRVATEGHALSRIKAASVAHLAAWVFPSAKLQTLQLASDFTAVLFLLDDAYDEGSLSADPGAVAKLNEKYLGELFGYVDADMDDPITRGLLDIRDRIRRDHPHFFLNRWLSHFQYYYEANLWEANNRMQRRVPGIDEYIRMRRYSGAVYPYCDLLELLLEQPLPLEVVEHPTLQGVREICNDILCWTNDYFSLEKELKSGEVHNLIVVLREIGGLTLQGAVAELKRMHDERIAEYQYLKSRMLAACPTNGIQQYLDATDAMIAGHQRWALAALRYSELGDMVAHAG